MNQLNRRGGRERTAKETPTLKVFLPGDDMYCKVKGV